jgi:decaprenylphospho-beta-D-erythro-pentofuranosid-2-ulose 2-reductase
MSAPEFNAVLIGATSAIATETARAMVAERPCRFLLIGRDPAKLEAVAQDLRVRGASAEIQTADFLDPSTDWKGLLQRFAAGRALDCVLIAHGELSDQSVCLADGPAFARSIGVNFTSAAFIASVAAEILATQNHGTLGVIGSVAGDRGRQSIFLYGSAKAGLDTFLEGLRHFHAGKPGVKIVTIKPGLIDTPMTAGVKKGPLCTSAEKAGQLVWKAMRQGKPIAYIPGWWRWILLVIRLIPRAIFYRTRL